MGQQPEGAEVGQQLFGEQRFEVDLDVRRTREAGVVAQDAQRQAVADDGPQRRIAGVQRLLRQHEGAAAARLAGVGVGLAESLSGTVQRLVEAGEDQGHAATGARMPDGVLVAGMLNGRATRSVMEVQHVAQQWQQPLAHGDIMRLHVLPAAQRLEILPEGERNLEVAGDFVAQLQALGDAVLRLGLLASLGVGQQGQAGQFLSGEQATFDADGAVGELVEGLLGHGVRLPRRWKWLHPAAARTGPSRRRAGWR